MLMWGLAIELAYRLEGDYDGVQIQLRGGAASGDSAPGFGTNGQNDPQRGFFRGDAEDDRTLGNFQFSPNYHIDLLMYRQILGTITESWYLSPGVAYDFDDNINLNAHVTYSQAMFKRSTPSCSDETQVNCRTEAGQTGFGKTEMGLEIDAEASYGLTHDLDGNAFRAAIQGGIVFPFGAFANPNRPEDSQGPNFAWTIQARMYVTF
jgi:uncharacterized protein (TIGR04551 family)